MAKNNFKRDKRQKELARKIKKEQKMQRKIEKNIIRSEENELPSQNEKES